MAAYEANRNLAHPDLMDLLRIRLIKACIAIDLVKIINTQMVFRAFILDQIILSEYPADILFYRPVLYFLTIRVSIRMGFLLSSYSG